MTTASEGNGKISACWPHVDCPLIARQDRTNEILEDIHDQMKLINRGLIGPATSSGRVPTRVLLWVIVAMTSVIVIQKVIDSGYEANAVGAGTSLSVHRAEKKTE